MARWTVSTVHTCLQGMTSRDERKITKDLLPTSSTRTVRPGHSSHLISIGIGSGPVRSGRGRTLPQLAAGSVGSLCLNLSHSSTCCPSSSNLENASLLLCFCISVKTFNLGELQAVVKCAFPTCRISWQSINSTI